MKAKELYRHTCQVCQCFFESHSDEGKEASSRICPECGAIGADGFIATEKITAINAALHSNYTAATGKM